MNTDIKELIMQHHWCQIKEVCLECKKPLWPDYLVCSRCSQFRYCSLQCLECGKPKHQFVCDMQRFFQQTFTSNEETRDMPTGILVDMFLKFKQQEAFVNSINMKLINENATKESVASDSQVTGGSQCSSDRVSESENQSGAGVGACCEAEGSESFGKGWWAANNKKSSKKFKLEDKSKHASCNDKVLGEENASSQNTSIFSVNSHSASSHSASSHSASSHSASSHSASSQDASSQNKDSSSESNHGTRSQDTSSHSADRPSHITDIHNTGSINMATSNLTNSIPSVSNTNGSPAASQTSKQSKPDSFGSGWWQAKKPQTSNATSNPINSIPSVSNTNGSPAASQTSKQSKPDSFGSGWWQAKKPQTSNATSNPINSIPSVSNTNGSPAASQTSKQSKSDSFGSGWWQAKKPQTSNATSSPTDKRKPEDNDSKQQEQNSARNISSSPNAVNRETSGNCGRTVASAENREQSNSNDFGSGWLKNQFLNNTKKEAHRPTAKPEKDSISTTGKKPKVQQQNFNGSSECVNKCTDVVPFKVFSSLEQIFRLAKVVSNIDSVAVEEEALHGRVIMTSFSLVPGQWKASLGGSHVSLLVEIVGRCFSSMLEILVRDKNGHTAQVLIKTESSMYPVPGSAMKIPYKKCTKPGNFVVLEAVSWEQLPSGKLVIVMRDIKKVFFICYATL